MRIEYTAPNPEKPHVLHVGLRYEVAVDGEDKINEVLCRKVKYNTLTAAQKLAYARECEKWHFKRDTSVRAAWDADDKVKADAIFRMVPQGYVKDETGKVTGIQVQVTWLGFSFSHIIPNDPTTAEANAKALHQAEKAKRDAEATALAAFNVG